MKSTYPINHSVIFELTRYYLIIDLTKFAEESDQFYNICVFDDKGQHDLTHSFIFNKEKNKFEVFKDRYKNSWLEEYGSYIGIALGAGFGAGVMHFLL